MILAFKLGKKLKSEDLERFKLYNVKKVIYYCSKKKGKKCDSNIPRRDDTIHLKHFIVPFFFIFRKTFHTVIDLFSNALQIFNNLSVFYQGILV